MEIQNLGEFGEYCKSRKWDVDLAEHLAFAEKLADTSVGMEGQYGGHGQPMQEWIEDAFRLVTRDKKVSTETLKTTQEVLTRFWKHGDAFDTWFKSKVIVVE